jgi:hypothetical protein
MKHHLSSIVIAATLFCPLLAGAATITYQGFLQEGFLPPQFFNLADDFVIAGTFAPGFNPFNYTHVYGDSEGNLTDPLHYTHAVADGNFRPIGAGTLSDATGAFSGSGTTTGIDNLPIYLFLSADADPNGFSDLFSDLAIVSSTDPTWRVQNDGIATLDAATANVFPLGSLLGNRIVLQVAPFPEPASPTLLLLGAALCLRRRSLRTHERNA